jgi:hypothetical protein
MHSALETLIADIHNQRSRCRSTVPAASLSLPYLSPYVFKLPPEAIA